MNNVSVFLYLADILSGIQVFFGMFGTIGLIFSIVAFAYSFMYDTDRVYLYGEKGYKDTIRYPLKAARPWAISFFVVTLLLVFGAIAIPSKETRYMIAASQVGEQIIQLEEVQQLGGETADLARVSIEALRNAISQTLPDSTNKPTEAE